MKNIVTVVERYIFFLKSVQKMVYSGQKIRRKMPYYERVPQKGV